MKEKSNESSPNSDKITTQLFKQHHLFTIMSVYLQFSKRCNISTQLFLLSTELKMTNAKLPMTYSTLKLSSSPEFTEYTSFT